MVLGLMFQVDRHWSGAVTCGTVGWCGRFLFGSSVWGITAVVWGERRRCLWMAQPDLPIVPRVGDDTSLDIEVYDRYWSGEVTFADVTICLYVGEHFFPTCPCGDLQQLVGDVYGWHNKICQVREFDTFAWCWLSREAFACAVSEAEFFCRQMRSNSVFEWIFCLDGCYCHRRQFKQSIVFLSAN